LIVQYKLAITLVYSAIMNNQDTIAIIMFTINYANIQSGNNDYLLKNNLEINIYFFKECKVTLINTIQRMSIL
jgi:hypothetical protein